MTALAALPKSSALSSRSNGIEPASNCLDGRVTEPSEQCKRLDDTGKPSGPLPLHRRTGDRMLWRRHLMCALPAMGRPGARHASCAWRSLEASGLSHIFTQKDIKILEVRSKPLTSSSALVIRPSKPRTGPSAPRRSKIKDPTGS